MNLLSLTCSWKEIEDSIPDSLLADDLKMAERLQRPEEKADVVLDTDTYNEVDDQYALAYLIRSSDRLNLKAIYAAPFLNSKASSVQEGMEKSFEEILKVLSLMGREDLAKIVYHGSDQFLMSENKPVISDAAQDLAKRAMLYTREKPLYVVAIGAITNIASALLLAPEIRERIVVIWLCGNALHWPHTKEFNMWQDMAASRIVFGCGVPLVQLPCRGVVSELTISGPELEYYLRGKNALCDYLADITVREASGTTRAVWTRVIWDVAAAAWLIDERFMEDCLIRAPEPRYDGHYRCEGVGHLMKYVYHINRDLIFTDLFEKLKR